MKIQNSIGKFNSLDNFLSNILVISFFSSSLLLYFHLSPSKEDPRIFSVWSLNSANFLALKTFLSLISLSLARPNPLTLFRRSLTSTARNNYYSKIKLHSSTTHLAQLMTFWFLFDFNNSSCYPPRNSIIKEIPFYRKD